MSRPRAEKEPLAALRDRVAEVAATVAEPPSAPTFTRPPDAAMGDYSSNAAMMLAGSVGSNPREVADGLAESLAAELGDLVERVEVAGPGFLNLYMDDEWFRRALESLAGSIAGAAPVPRVVGESVGEVEDPLFGLGPTPVTEPLRYLVEFVSANPTGPLTAASGRHGAYGDSLCRLLEALGHEVWREYYVNDAGGQIERLAQSVAAKMTGEEPPEDGYGGDYIEGMARRFAADGMVVIPDEFAGPGFGKEAIQLPIDPSDLETVGRAAVYETLGWIRETLGAYRVHFNHWTFERDLHESGKVKHAVEDLTEAGRTYESEGAVWLRTTEFGDDKDRVLIRSGGEPTYFAADVAYHAEKLRRGFDRLIDVLGADHHGYLGRMEAAIAALGAQPEAFEAQIMQMLSIVEGGERAQMSKRRGDFVTLQELIDEIGTDATRFFMLQRGHETPFDLDLDLAKRESSDNPVYYVQYAHARIASILRKAAAEGALAAGLPESLEVSLEPAERDLIKRLLELPDEIREAAERRAPHRICAYATAIASDFHAFYRDCKVVGAGDPGLERFRLVLCLVAKRTLAATLGLLGISAPERM